MYEIVAMATMLIDHIGAYIYPEIVILRVIGRIAFPLYAYKIIQGMKYTRDIKRYIRRLFIIALVSQIPTILLGKYQLNVIFGFICFLIGEQLLKNKSKIVKIITMAALMIIAEAVIEYGSYGIALLCIYKSEQAEIMKHWLLNLIFIPAAGWILQPVSIISTYLIKYTKAEPLGKPGRYLYLVFYPLHLIVIYLIKII